MVSATENITIFTCKALIKPECVGEFADWQAKLNIAIAEHPGFVSLEILSPALPEQPEWLIVQRFYNQEDVVAWRKSGIRLKLMEELKKYLVAGKEEVEEIASSASSIQGGVTEVFVTQINPKNEKAYHKWMAKIHQVEAKFPGFKGVYMQSPNQGGINWITLLHFDTPENLDRWLSSPERQKVLSESKTLISSLESHRMISPFAGWFASVAKAGALPPAWKQTMITLLVLFPIVMFELKYLSLWTRGLNPSLATFISNAISVVLISWPMMPLAILLLRWWLVPQSEKYLQATVLGTILIVFLYVAEIAVLWNFL